MAANSYSQPAGQRLERAIADSPERAFFLALIVVAVLELWVVPLRGSLWIDEISTYWIVNDGLANVFARAIDWSGQSPFYYLAAWVAHLAGGRNEVILRLPSLLAMIAAASLLYKLAARLFGAETAPFSALVFVCSEQVAFEAADARPYALGLCLLIASALMLVRWIDTGRPRYAAAYSLLAALTIYAHILLGIVLVWHALYALFRFRHAGVVKLSALLASWAFTGLLCVPLIAQLLVFFRTRGSHSWSGTPTFSELLASLTPAALTVPVGVGLLIGWLAIRPHSETDRCVLPRRESMVLAAGWAFLPPVALYLVSVFTDTKLFVPRYFVSAAPGLALVAGAWIRALPHARLRWIVALAVFAAAIRSFGTWQHSDENWAGAMAKVRALTAGADTPVVMASAFIEATDPAALTTPRLQEVLFAPLAIYPAGGTLIRLPFRLDEKSELYLEDIVATDLEYRARFVFVGRWQGVTFEPWLRGRLASLGFRSESQGDFGNIGVFLFSKHPPPDP